MVNQANKVPQVLTERDRELIHLSHEIARIRNLSGKEMTEALNQLQAWVSGRMTVKDTPEYRCARCETDAVQVSVVCRNSQCTRYGTQILIQTSDLPLGPARLWHSCKAGAPPIRA